MDEDVQREAWLLQLELAALTSTDQLSSLQQEIRILQVGFATSDTASLITRCPERSPYCGMQKDVRQRLAAHSLPCSVRHFIR